MLTDTNLREVPAEKTDREIYCDAVQDLERAKERITDEASRQVAENARALIRDFVEVLDDLERVLGASKDTSGVLEQGVELARRRFLTKLAKYGVTPIETTGAFNAQIHEALSTMPVASELHGQIVETIKTGYRMNQQLLRPAQVVVGQYAG